MPQVDHRIGQGLERVMQRTDAFEAQQQAPELVFPGKHALDGAETLFKDKRDRRTACGRAWWFSWRVDWG